MSQIKSCILSLVHMYILLLLTLLVSGFLRILMTLTLTCTG